MGGYKLKNMRRLLLSMSLFCILSANAVTTPEDIVPEQEVKHVRGAGALLELMAATSAADPTEAPTDAAGDDYGSGFEDSGSGDELTQGYSSGDESGSGFEDSGSGDELTQGYSSGV